jgi:hypothetical protein
MLRTTFAVISGLFAMMIVITFVEIANAKFFFPPPPALDLTSETAVAAYASTMPATALGVVLSGWLLGAFAGALVAARIASEHRLACALIIGVVDVVLTALNAMSIPHPTWMLATGLLLPIPLAWLAARLAQKGLASTR